MPWPTTNPPVQEEPRRLSASSFSSLAVTAQPSASTRLATLEPTRPQPMMIAFTSSAYRGNRVWQLASILFEDALRKCHDEDFAGRSAEHVLDRRREEPRLPAPARRRAKDDQIGVASLRFV